ncbi:uncharacterized protein [Atheta coriaria]|uniref:uncharacterized protein isoform X10 n=1 Tax=Dalotia coriaria TaxID=877792 RepID=UPI0031F3B8C9
MPEDNRSFTKFGRTPCRRTTVLSPNSGERHAGGQPFFHQIRANAMPEDNRSFTKFGRTPCRRTTVLSPNSGERHAGGQPFFHQIAIAGERHAGGQPFFHQIVGIEILYYFHI